MIGKIEIETERMTVQAEIEKTIVVVEVRIFVK